MNAWLLAARLLAFLIGAVHSVMGETRIFRHMRQGGLVPTDGAPLLREFQVRILWGSWHLVTGFSWCISALLIRAGQPDVPPSLRHDLVAIGTLTLAAAALLVAGATRGKHPAWLTLLLAAGLAAMGWD